MSDDALTRGERLLIYRLRKGWNQSTAARKFKATYHTYTHWEMDRETRRFTPTILPGIPYQMEELAHHERARLYRRRAVVLQKDVAAEMGVCAWTVAKMEDGRADPTDLLCYWES